MLRVAIRYIASLFGLEIRRRGIQARLLQKFRDDVEHTKWSVLHRGGIDVVLDVGANTGQFASKVAHYLPNARIISFEPLPEEYAELKSSLARLPHFEAYQVALGSEPADTVIYRSSFSPSSSLRSMTERHIAEWPESAGSTEVPIRVERLDDVVVNLATKIDGWVLLKLDVQGHEIDVLKGAEKILNSVTMILIEVSFEEFYSGQPSFDDVNDWMRNAGFQYRGSFEQFMNRAGDRYIFADAIYTRGEFQ